MSKPENAAGGQPGEPLAGPGAFMPAPERDKWGHLICRHGRVHKSCKECGGSQICTHGRRRSNCKECGGSQICEHRRVRGECLSCHPEVAFRALKRNAKRRNIACTLTQQQAQHISSQPCFYCGGSAGWIDRRKNEWGYTPTNSIPCCSWDNMRKGTATAGQYIEGSQRVAQYCVDRETFMARNAELQKQLKEFEQWQSESTSAEPAE